LLSSPREKFRATPQLRRSVGGKLRAGVNAYRASSGSRRCGRGVMEPAPSPGNHVMPKQRAGRTVNMIHIRRDTH